MADKHYTAEHELVADFIGQLDRLAELSKKPPKWTVYPETAGWDLLLVHNSGFQVGLEAKLTLNAKVIDQALVNANSRFNTAGPDYRGVLVPVGGAQHHLERICDAIGIGIVRVGPARQGVYRYFGLPGGGDYSRDWPKSPVMLTEWKIKAIKLMILLERRGAVHRSDMRALKISPSRWTDAYHGFLAPTSGGYVRCDRTPDLKAQHPRNWAEIEADFDKWNPYKMETA
jgi:hypothetical protein